MRSALEIALFVDATETLFRIGDQLHHQGFPLPAPPQRHGVANADEIRERVLRGINPIAAMSLDDAMGIRYGDDPAGHDLTVFAGVHRGFLELMVAPDLEQVPQLRGLRIGIDTETGYARALMELMRRASLRRDLDFSVVKAGATNRRFERLLSGEIDAALLGSPFTDLAKARQFRSLGSVPELLGGYQAVVLVAKAAWLNEHPDQARSVVACLLGAARWAFDPINAEPLIAMLEQCISVPHTLETRRSIAVTLFGAGTQYLRDGCIHDRDLQVVVDLYNHDLGTTLTPQHLRSWITDAFLPVND